MWKLTGIAFGFCLALVLGTAPASAIPLKWTLYDARFEDGAKAYGSFVYDTATNAFSAIDITTTPGALFSGEHYIAGPNGWLGDPLIFAAHPGKYIDYTDVPNILLIGTRDRTDAGGVIPLWLASSGELLCNVPDCSSSRWTRKLVSEVMSTQGVPEPATLATLVAGLLCLGMLYGITRRSGAG